MSTGIVTGSSKVQLALGAREPPVKLRFEVPVICEPTPHTSFNGKPVATNPVIAASRSSLNVRPFALKPLPLLSMVKRSVLVFEPVNVSGVKSLVKVGAGAANVSCALASATGLKPVTVSALVVLV